MSFAGTTIALLTALPLGTPRQEIAPPQEAFPASTALAEGVSPEALAGLDQLVQSLVDDAEIVGAELLVIKNGHSILHEAYGWRDRDAQVPMETGSVFCVRSMTKPVIGAAILMLIEDDLLELDDRVAQYLPSFDVEGSRDITVEQLLTHTSGMPMSQIMGMKLKDLEGIRAVAELGAGVELKFEPGSDFSYSDQGTDTLTALIEVVTAAPVADFVRKRVLEPLGMRDSTCVMTEDHALRARTCSKYAGAPGSWKRFWSPSEPPLFPFFLGSQGLYSTLPDYARFMDMWLRKGRVGRERILRPRLVRKALKRGPHPMRGPTALPELKTGYGFLMQLWTGPPAEDSEDGAREVVAFGHTGSDGTHAWVFPEQKAMVLYFTQSRGTSSGLRVEEALGELLLGVPYDPSQAAPPLEQYLGYYWEHDDDLYRAIIRDGDDLALEVLGKGIVPLSYIGEDRWKMRPNPSVVLAFQRSDAGEVTGYHIGDHKEYRFEPSAELPAADDVAQRVAQAHRIDLLETLGPLRLKGTLSIPAVNITGELDSLVVWPDRIRIDTVAGEESEHLVIDGERVSYASSTVPPATLEGQRAQLMLEGSFFARLGDWRKRHAMLKVVQRLERGGREVLLVRTGDTSAPAMTLYVDAETGRVVHLDGMTYIEGAGRVGQRIDFGDFRDVSGMLLPFRSEIELAVPFIGTITATTTEFEVGVELPEDAFELGGENSVR